MSTPPTGPPPGPPSKLIIPELPPSSRHAPGSGACLTGPQPAR